MRPQIVSQLPTDVSKWIYEPKLDGCRAVAVQTKNKIDLFSMEGRKVNERFPKVVEALKRLTPADLVLDGELVALEANGRPNLNELQYAAKTKLPIHYIVFDVLHHKGKDLLDLPLKERKTILLMRWFVSL
jgi:bifunctional non-homologous end joining protein LigD